MYCRRTVLDLVACAFVTSATGLASPRRAVAFMSTGRAPVIVRRAADSLLIEVRLAGQQQPRTLQRPATEELQRSLTRLGSTFGTSKRGKQKKGQPIEAPLEASLHDSSGAVIDPTTPACEAWSSAVSLQVGPTVLDILFEPGEVSLLLMPTTPLVGVPMLPYVETRACDADQLKWLWERLPAQSDKWEAVGCAREYVPTSADTGAQLRVCVEPPLPASAESEAALAILGIVTEAAGLVKAPVPRRLLRGRVEAMNPSASVDDGRFRVLSYNLLADCYSRHWDEPGSVHSYCAPVLTKGAYRMARLLEEVLAFSPDILCLQECDRSWYEQHWTPALHARGYVGHHTNKLSAGSSEGVATFVRSVAFEIVETRDIALNGARPNSMPPALSTLLHAQPATGDGTRTLPTVAQLLLLRERTRDHATSASASPRELIVVNTHLYFANPAVHVRLLQMSTILQCAHAWVAERSSDDAPAPALIVAGDLNSDSTDAVLRLLTDGRVGADDPDWLHGAVHWAPSLQLERAALDAAAGMAAVLGSCLDEGMDVESVWASQQLDTVARAPPSPPPEAAVPTSVADPTLASAQAVGIEYHLLRKAMQRLAQAAATRPPPPAKAVGTSTGDEALDATTLAVAIVADTAAGRSLLQSEALAAAQVSWQLKLPLSAVVGADPMEVIHAARRRLDELGAQLDATCAAVRTRVSTELEKPSAANGTGNGEDEGKSAEEEWAARAAGVHLSQPTPLTSAYGLHTQPTHVVPRYANALDWICCDTTRLDVVSVAPLPPHAELTRDVAMPSAEFPSDHTSLVVDLAWRESDNEVEERGT